MAACYSISKLNPTLSAFLAVLFILSAARLRVLFDLEMEFYRSQFSPMCIAAGKC